MRRRKLLLVTVGAIVLVGAGTVDAMRPRPRFTMEQVHGIHVGMVVDDVASVLGCQPGNYTDDLFADISTNFVFSMDDLLLLGSPQRFVLWQCEWRIASADPDGRPRRDALAVQVRLDERGRVERIRPMFVNYRVPSATERVLWRLDGIRAKLGL